MDLTKKQKIILTVVAIIVVLIGCYYVYSKDNDFISTEENIINDETDVKEKQEYSDTMIIIHVSGAVNQEGIVELNPNSRIADAIDKAGGLREDAYIDKINLAYVLEDGMKIYIPNVNEKTQNQDLTNTSDNEDNYVTKESGVQTANADGTTKANSNNQNQSSNKKMNINKATESELESLPGIGPSTAQKIISYRNEKGKFNSIEDIKNVSGIGDSKYNNIKGLISIK